MPKPRPIWPLGRSAFAARLAEDGSRGWPKPGAAHGLILPLRGPVGGGSARSERRLVLRTGVQRLLVRHRLQQPHRDGGLPVGVRRPRPTPCLKPSTLLYSEPNSPTRCARVSAPRTCRLLLSLRRAMRGEPSPTEPTACANMQARADVRRHRYELRDGAAQPDRLRREWRDRVDVGRRQRRRAQPHLALGHAYHRQRGHPGAAAWQSSHVAPAQQI